MRGFRMVNFPYKNTIPTTPGRSRRKSSIGITMCIQSQFKNGLIVGIVGVVFTTLIAVLGWVGVPDIIDNVARKNTVLEEDKLIWDLWQVPSFPIYTDFYIFNCTNYQDVVAIGAKPIVEELGPYSYRETRYKNTSVLANTDETVYYREHRLYYYSQNTSGSGTSPSDSITIINPVYTTLSLILNRLPESAAVTSVVDFINDYLNQAGESVFMTVTVEQLLFTGWPLDTYIDLYLKVKNLLENWPSGPLIPPLPPNLPPLPDLPPSITNGFSIGLFTTRNNTDDGLFRVNRGTSDYTQFGKIEAWARELEDLSPFLTYWKGGESYCNAILGTDGSIFPQGTSLTNKLYLYQSDLCRTVYLVHESDETFEDLPAAKFVLPKSALENRTNAPENECFCLDENNEGRCPNTGAMFIGACYEGAPIIGSLPHFFNGDERYKNGVEGLSPNKDKHQTVIYMEKRTNVLLYAAKRVQLSFDLQKTRLSETQNLTTRVFLPMLWYEENVSVDEATKDEFKLFTTIEIVLWVLFGAGLVLTIVGVILILDYFRKERNGHKVV